MMRASRFAAVRLALCPLVLFVATVLPTRAAPSEVPVRHLAVRELWRLPAEDEDYLVSTLTDGALDPRGNICLADFKQKCAFVFARDGSYLRTLGRGGEGPGESQDVRSVFFDGERYGLLQAVPGAIVWLKGDGAPAGKVQIARGATEGESFVSVAWGQQDGGRILAWINRSSIRDSRLVAGDEGLVEVAPDGSVGPLLYRQPDVESARSEGGIDEGKVFDIWMRRWCGDGRGGVWVAPDRDRYLLQHWGPDGRLLKEVRLPYEPLARSALAREKTLEWMKQRGWREEQVKVGRTAPVIASLRLGADGRLWARLDLGGELRHGDVSRIYDVFDGDGRHLEQVHIHGGDVTSARVVLDDATMVSLVDDEQVEGEQWLVLEGLEPVAAGPGAGH